MSTVSKRVKGKQQIPVVPPGPPVQPAQPVRPTGYFRWKGAIDRAAAAVLLLPGLPIMAVLAFLVRLSSRGPIIYRQRRVGRKGRVFSLYKFRSMRHDAESQTGAVWAQASDPRVTRLGQILRRTHLDELPQLFNVLKGEMSLVGPRPERPEFVPVLAASIPGYTNRIEVVPGVTGLAQLNLPPDTDLDSVRRKLVLDLEYIGHAGLWLDMRLFLATACRIVKLPERWVHGVLRTGRSVALPERAATTNGTNGHSHPAAASASESESAQTAPSASAAGGNGNGRHEGRGPQDGDGRAPHEAAGHAPAGHAPDGHAPDAAHPNKPR